jgi:membrane protein DedA with SNARE-associated domain
VVDKAALYVYFGIFFALVAAGLGFPIPEELPILTAGGLVGHVQAEPNPYERVPEFMMTLDASPYLGFPANLPWAALARCSQIELDPAPSPPVRLRWYIMLPLCILGVVISDGLLYGMGRYFGPRLLEIRWMKRLLPDEKRRRIEHNFHQYGVLVLLFARFLPAIRSPIFITAGVMRVSCARFLLADGLYAIPGVSLLFFLAYWFGNQFTNLILRAEERLKPLLILVGISALAGFLLHHFLRHPVATGDPEELPVIGEQVAHKIEHAQTLETHITASPEAAVSPDGTASHGKQAEAVRRDGSP